MKAFFVVIKDDVVLRTGRATREMVPPQAVEEGSQAFEIDGQYVPNDLYVVDGDVRRVSDDVSVIVTED